MTPPHRSPLSEARPARPPLRQAVGLSQEDACAEAGPDRTYFSRIERGLVNPSFTTLEKIAAALKVAPGDLFDD